MSSQAEFSSEIESAILASTEPLLLNETEEINLDGYEGIWMNKNEVINWKGSIPIEQYSLNEDPNPQIILKKTEQQLEYIQELAIRYLRPPTPKVSPGDIFIKLENCSLTPPAPPLVIRQQAARPATPEPLLIREEPPKAPNLIGQTIITISGKNLPPPPRKVVIERLPSMPPKPQSVIIERWLPYSEPKRKVILQRSNESFFLEPKNVIVQWEAPPVSVKTVVKYLGVTSADPNDYVLKYGSSLKDSKDLPKFVLDIETPSNLKLAADVQSIVPELEGDLDALNLVDLDFEGLSEYRKYLQV